ncbi:MAG TPA: penicillin acylase family protein [Mycobacteriales bacterium]|nr:penicillin acylase family protein [Mycobacteriales bacterium]
MPVVPPTRLLAVGGALAALALPSTLIATSPSTAAHSTATARPAAHATATHHHYDVTITRTEGGIPHIVGKNFGDIGYGYGYAFAQDNLCTMADAYITVEGQRARYFGPNGDYTQGGNGVTVNNLDSDIFWTEVRQSGIVDRLSHRKPPNGPTKGLQAGVHGYVAGYNRYLRDIGGPKGVKDPHCHGKPWVKPITVRDAYLRFYQLVLLASSDVVIPGIVGAKPPSLTDPVPTPLDTQRTGRLIAQRLQRGLGAIGSNAVAIGKAGTRDHKHGMLLGNPHFPWVGPERFYQAQIHIPGKVNVTGASLFGVPLVLIGHTMRMAWSHTVSTAFRFTPYELTLVPGQPTEYLEDGKVYQMQPRTVTVTSRGAGGKLTRVTHTLWWTRYGPVFNSIEGIPLPWTLATAFTLRDANATNFRIFNHFLKTDMAQSAHQELRILDKYEGIPWVNTIVADKTGHALYADIGTVPHVTNAEEQRCNTALGLVTTKLAGLPVLNGSTKSCDWGSDKDAAVPGIFGPHNLPHLFRSDYVTNSNDSYWLANPHHPLTGFAHIIGSENTPRSLRTRIGLIMTQARVSGTDHRGPPGFTLRDMQHMVFSDRQYAGELTRNSLVSLCKTFQTVGVIPDLVGVVKVGDACSVLAHWDLHENATSHGAILFRRFWDNLTGGTVGSLLGRAGVAAYWLHGFSAKDPVHTPNTLNVADPEVALALGNAINDLRKAGLPLGVAPDQVQGVHRHGKFIPLQGGPGDPNGEFNAIYAPWIPGKGLGDVTDGSSFVQAVTWQNGHRCPVARTILTYSESTDPTRPDYDDQTKMFSKKHWVRDRFCAGAIRADKHRTVLHLSGV